jgi:hypothetical protein
VIIHTGFGQEQIKSRCERPAAGLRKVILYPFNGKNEPLYEQRRDVYTAGYDGVGLFLWFA